MVDTLIITQFVSRLQKWMCTLCNICVRCASVVVESVKKFNMGIVNFLSVDLKSHTEKHASSTTTLAF
jgi:hypothetical protein